MVTKSRTKGSSVTARISRRLETFPASKSNDDIEDVQQAQPLQYVVFS